MAYPIDRGYQAGRGTIIIPPTTDMALVFPFDQENKKFDKNFYSPFLTDGRASHEQVEYFLNEVEKTFQKKLKWLKRFRTYLVFAFVTGFSFMMFYSVAVLSSIDDEDDSYYYNQAEARHHTTNKGHTKSFRHQDKRQEYDIEDQIDLMFMAWFFLMFAAMVWGLIYNCVKQASLKKARKGVQEIVDKYAAHFSSFGLRWNLPLTFPHYIELWKDYKGQNYTQASNNGPYHTNPLSFQQIQNQLHSQNQIQRYPILSGNQVVDQRVNFADNQDHGPSIPLLNNQAQRREFNDYVPPYPINFVANSQ